MIQRIRFDEIKYKRDVIQRKIPLNSTKAISGIEKNENSGFTTGRKISFFHAQPGIPEINSGGTTKNRTAICAIWALNITWPNKSTGLPAAA